MRKPEDEQFDHDASRRVAEALRASAETDLPAASAALREAVERKLIQQEEPVMVREKQTRRRRSKHDWSSWGTIGVSICLLVAMGAAVWTTRQHHAEQIAMAERQQHANELRITVQPHENVIGLDVHGNVINDGLVDLVYDQWAFSSHSPSFGGFDAPGITLYNGQQQFQPGDVVDLKRVRDSERRLKASQLFASDAPAGGPTVREIKRDFQQLQQSQSFRTEATAQRDRFGMHSVAPRELGIGRPTLGMLPGKAISGEVAVNAGPGGLVVRGARGEQLARAFHDGPGFPPADGELPAEGERPGSAEAYDAIHENAFLPVRGESAVSTFSIDVDTASYSNIRRFLTRGSLPPADAVRIEELVNYFHYDYPQPKGDAPFSANMELAGCPWNDKHQLLRVALKGKEIAAKDRPAANLVFLLDVSGSMQSYDKLPLVQNAMKLLVGQLREDDHVAIVVYAGAAGLVLDTTSGMDELKIRDAIDRLRAGGSTNGSAGIVLAYEKALASFIDGGVNRVILCTDGDLNVGVTDDASLVELIKEKAANDVFLTVLGFGTGNLKDSKLEKLADNGNGNYAYIDNLKEARKVLVEQMGGSLITIAKDVKLQLEFNPAEVRAYRLIGYENRILAAKDFDDDTKDAGEIGAGHTVTALYELVPVGSDEKLPGIDPEQEKPQPLKYQQTLGTDEKEAAPAKEEEADKPQDAPRLTKAAKSGELLTLALRYKQPEGDVSTRLEFTLPAKAKAFNKASRDFQFAASVASFGMLLRRSRYAGDSSFASVEEIARGALGDDKEGRRQEFIDLVQQAEQLTPRK
ncbi:MAG: VWA domain-containing protein [Pirellulaceae bacterium]